MFISSHFIILSLLTFSRGSAQGDEPSNAKGFHLLCLYSFGRVGALPIFDILIRGLVPVE